MRTDSHYFAKCYICDDLTLFPLWVKFRPQADISPDAIEEGPQPWCWTCANKWTEYIDWQSINEKWKLDESIPRRYDDPE
jgi:hypothetical protein